jgi:hypothetical protein
MKTYRRFPPIYIGFFYLNSNESYDDRSFGRGRRAPGPSDRCQSRPGGALSVNEREETKEGGGA